jgi:ribosomal protein L11 methylase PrmA
MAADLQRLTRRCLAVAGILADREHLVTDAFSWTPTSREQDGEWVSLRFLRPQ